MIVIPNDYWLVFHPPANHQPAGVLNTAPSVPFGSQHQEVLGHHTTHPERALGPRGTKLEPAMVYIYICIHTCIYTYIYTHT